LQEVLMAGTTDRVVEALARLHRHSEAQDAKKGEHPPITVAISREAGSRGAEIARAAGARLGWPVYDREIINHIAAEKGLQAALLARLDERYVNWLEDAVRALCTRDSGTEGDFMRGLLELMASLGKAGHHVIVGRGTPHMLPAERTLRVRVIAPRAFRIAQVQKSQGMSASAAERWVDVTDRDRLRFAERYFGVNAADPLRYDLILNSSRLSIDECAALIEKAASQLEARSPLAPA
jgi:cytidylate kinase